MALTQRLGRNGSVDFWDSERKIGSWSGYTNNLIYIPEQGESFSVGRYEPEYLPHGSRQLERLRNLQAITAVKAAMDFEEWAEEIEDLVYQAVGVDVSWDWPRRKSFDRRLSPHEAAIECIKAALAG